MKVPDKIQIIGSEITTVYEELLLEESGCSGQTNPPFNEIRLRRKIAGREIGEDKLFETYTHELVHTILNKIGYEELSNDEAFVTSLSNVLVQVIKQLEK